MKKIWYFYLLLFGLGSTISSCEKEPGVVTFNIEQKVTFTIAPNTLLDILSVAVPGVNNTWDGQFANHNTNKEKLRELKLTEADLQITSPPGKTFKFLEWIRVYIKADGLQETMIAYHDNIPSTIGQSLSLNTVDVDLTPYAKKESFSIRIDSKPREYNTDYVDVDMDLTFKVSAQLLD